MTDSLKLNKTIIATVDMAIFIGSFFLAFYLRYGSNFPTRNREDFYYMLPWFIIIFAVLLFAFDLYSIYTKFDERLISIICVVILAGMANICLSFIFRHLAVPRSIFLISAAVQMGVLILWRYIVWRKGLLIKKPKKAVVVGYNGEIKKLLNSINVALSRGLTITKEIKLNNKDHFNSNWCHFINSPLAGEIDVILICSSLTKDDKNLILSYAVREKSR